MFITEWTVVCVHYRVDCGVCSLQSGLWCVLITVEWTVVCVHHCRVFSLLGNMWELVLMIVFNVQVLV